MGFHRKWKRLSAAEVVFSFCPGTESPTRKPTENHASRYLVHCHPIPIGSNLLLGASSGATQWGILFSPQLLVLWHSPTLHSSTKCQGTAFYLLAVVLLQSDGHTRQCKIHIYLVTLECNYFVIFTGITSYSPK